MPHCPPQEKLEALLAEALDSAERAAIEAHVEQCEDCQETLHNLTMGAADPVSAAMTSSRRDSTTIDGDIRAEAFFDRLKRMKPPGDDAAPEQDAATQELARVEGYQILGELGRGAAGVVYRALHLKLNRLVALKVIVAGPHMSPEVRQRFRVEAHAIARLQHANIVRIYDVGEHAEFPYLSLELIDGGNLADWLRGKPRSATESARIIATLAKAVEYAHVQGVVHRDLKPANVLLAVRPDRPGKHQLKITDFGIAKVIPVGGISEARMTQTGEILGTPAYMAPEQARGNANEIVPATDVYSLGAILYELLTGKPPFQGATPLDTLMQASRQDPVSVRVLVPRVPRDLDTICLKCLEKESSKRYQTAAELAEDLGRFLHNEPIHARPISWAGQTVRWVRRHQGLAAALSAVVILLVLLTGTSMFATAHFRKLDLQSRALATEKSALADEKEIQRGKAVRAEQREVELRKQAEQDGRELRKSLYFNQMNLGAQAAKSPSGIGRVSEWLAHWAQEMPDLRNWEWYYLDGLCHRDLMTLTGHINGVLDGAWSPNGKWLASAGVDGSVRIWDVRLGEEVHRCKEHTREVLRIAWSPDGNRLASASLDGQVKLWNVETGKSVLTFAGHHTPVFSVAWSPDGARIASGGQDRTIQIWDASTGKVKTTIQVRDDTVHDVEFSPDGAKIAAADADFTAGIWEVASGREIGRLKGHINMIRRVTWNPDGKHIATASNDGSIRIWNAATGETLTTLHGHVMAISSVTWSPDGQRLASSSDDQTIKVWSATDSAELFTFRGHHQQTTAAVWSPDGTRLASTSYDGSIKIWSTMGQPEVPVLRGHDGSVFSIAWSPDNQWLASTGADQTLKVWNVHTAKEQFTLHEHTDWLRAVAWSLDGRLASAGDDHTIRIWDASTGKHLNTIHVDTDQVYCLAWSRDSQRLASGGSDRIVRIWDPVGEKELQQCVGHAERVYSVAWHPGGMRLASGSFDQTARIWDVQTGKSLLSLTAHTSEVKSVAWSPDGQRLATASNDQTVNLWNGNTGDLQLTLRGHTTCVTGVTWNPDGTRLATSSEDRTVKIWDVATGKETVSLDHHQNTVGCVAWSPDGLSLASGSEDRTILIYDARSGYLAARSPMYLTSLDRRLAIDPTNALNWHTRSEINAQRDNWPEATKDVQHALALDANKQWYTLGYWVVGPYPEDMSLSFAPEKDPSPGQMVAPAEAGDSVPPLPWQHVELTRPGFVDFGYLFAHKPHISAYAMLRVFSPRPQKVAALLGHDHHIRLWLNGKQVYENLHEALAAPDQAAVPIILAPGWNTLLARVSNVSGEHVLYLRLSAEPADLKRADGEK